jgi:thioredoxin reductase
MQTNGNKTDGSFEYLIIGAGPAGLQLGYFLEKAGRNYLILEAGNTAGTFFKRFPRHRTLISSNKVYTGYDDKERNLRWDWNSLLCDKDELLFAKYSKEYFPPADEMVRYLTDFAEAYKLNIRYQTRAVRIGKKADFEVVDQNGKAYSGKRLIIAAGFTKPYLPPVPGIELAELYTEVSVDPDDFINQKVLILGKGNSGFETAENLIPTAAVIHLASPNPVSMAWKTHFVGHLRAVNNNFLDTYQLKSQNAVLDASVENIERGGDGKYVVSLRYTHANGEKEDLIYDRVIACTGFRFDPSIFDETCRPELTINDRFPNQTSSWESTNVKGLYFAGTLTQARDFKKSTSGFIHGYRYNISALHRIFEQTYHENPLPSYPVPSTARGLVDAVIKRVNESSALWQQFGFLCDLIVVPETGEGARYYEELPVDYVRDTRSGLNDPYYTVTLEFGKITSDPFNIERHPEPGQAARSTFLHPVIRRFAGGGLIAEHHILEDLYGEWVKEEAHIRPLHEFFEHALRGAATVLQDQG